VNRILAFSTHPDDIELYAGGTLLNHVRDGSQVSVILMTYGDQGSILPMTSQRQDFLRRARAEETRQRFQKVPSVELRMLGLPDRSVCRRELERYFRTRKNGKKLGTRFAEAFREVKTDFITDG
jgi:LmbE family N-acetylglucosaminyl deacetylase